MRPKTHTLTVRGHKVRTRTPRRFIVVAVRPEPLVTPEGTYAAFAHVEKRTDALATARAVVRRYGVGMGCFAVVIDTETREEI